MLVKNTKRANERNENSTYALIDSQSVKTTSASKKRDHNGEKTKGQKRHIVIDIMGNLLYINVHTTNVNDTKYGVFPFEKVLFYYPSIKGVCADSAYKNHFKNIFEEFHNLKISKRLTSTSQTIPKYLRIERTFSWLSHFGRLLKNYEIRTVYTGVMIIISPLHTLLRRF